MRGFIDHLPGWTHSAGKLGFASGPGPVFLGSSKGRNCLLLLPPLAEGESNISRIFSGLHIEKSIDPVRRDSPPSSRSRDDKDAKTAVQTAVGSFPVLRLGLLGKNTSVEAMSESSASVALVGGIWPAPSRDEMIVVG